jgi:Amt family ammonium transporter
MQIRDMGLIWGIAILIRVGQTLLLAGLVRSKNAASIAVRCTLDLAIITLALWAIGGLFVPTPRVDGRLPLLSFGHLFGNDDGAAFYLLPALMICTAAAIGATAERVRLLPNLIWTGSVAAVLLPLVRRIGLAMGNLNMRTDVALLAAIVGGGLAALILAAIAGARKGKFNRDLSVNFVPGHAVVFQFVGLLILAAGFATATRNGIHVLLGLGAALLAGAAFGKFRFGKIDAGLMVSAGVGGLCAGGLAAFTPTVTNSLLGSGGAPAVLAGAISGVIVPWAVMWTETRWRIDDVAGLGVAFLVSGTVGQVIAALLRRTSTVGVYFKALLLDLVIWLLVLAVFGGVAFLIGKLCSARGLVRVSEGVEYDGVDLSDLDVNAYPDFQQTMIKSHHLRQL